MAGKCHGDRLLPVMLPKAALVVGEYYVGLCRNAAVARWDGVVFHHWRRKCGTDFIETIKHPDDEEYFDVFVPVAHAVGHEARPIEFTEVSSSG